jgi:hypothetical protein
MGKKIVESTEVSLEIEPAIESAFTVMGMVERCSIPDILNLLNIQKKTGVLIVRYEDVEKKIYMKDGEIVFASSNLKEDRLGESLVRRGKITMAQLEEASKEVKEGKKLGRVLVEKGWITPKELFYGVRAQVQEIIFNLFPLSSGYFYFLEGVFDHENVVRFNMSTQMLIMEGIRISDELVVYKRMYPFKWFVLKKEGVDEPVDPMEKLVFKEIGEGIRIEDLKFKTGLSEYKLLKIIHQLKEGNFVDVKETKPIPSTKIEEFLNDVNSIISDIYSIIKFKSGDFDYLHFFNNFFEDMPEEVAEIFDGIFLRDDGSIDVSKIFENFKKSKNPNKENLLLSALKELIRFELFELKLYLSEEENAELQKILSETGIME